MEDYPENLAEAAVVPVMFAGVGGSSILFGAQWMRLAPSDFRVRSLDGVADDWPIDHFELEPYYDRVDKCLGVAGPGGDPAYPPIEYDMPPHPMGKGGLLAARALNKLGWHGWPGSQAIPSANHKRMVKCVRWGVCETGCPAGAKASFDLGHRPHATAAGAQLVTGAHDAPNLFIVDGSVMLTSGGRNPTSTITAPALRAAEHMADTARVLQVPA
jgi:choline dehydrogenase-like flavoprotein